MIIEVQPRAFGTFWGSRTRVGPWSGPGAAAFTPPPPSREGPVPSASGCDSRTRHSILSLAERLSPAPCSQQTIFRELGGEKALQILCSPSLHSVIH